ncbi:MAG: segregation and condensation protein B [Cocleimonas sp.]|jgi:segregation and condensation protein B
MQAEKLKNVLEAILISADKPLAIEKLLGFFQEEDLVNRNDLKKALFDLQQSFTNQGFELIETASGYRFQTKEEYKQWVTQHWDEKPAKYSRALLETLALIVYRQPITRAEIEDIRGVAVSSHIIKTLQERDWIRIVGHKEVPGRPSLLGTTRHFLDYFNLKSLDEMPSLSEIQDIDKLYPELNLKMQEELGIIEQENTTEDKLDSSAMSETIVDSEEQTQSKQD